MQFLANWLHVAGRGLGGPGRRLVRRHRLDAWVDPARGRRPAGRTSTCGCADAAEAPTRQPGRAAGWTGSTRTRSRPSGSAWSPLRAAGHADPVVRLEDLRQPVEPPLGDAGRRRGSTGRTGSPGQRPDLLAARSRAPTACSCARRPPAATTAGRSTGSCSRMPTGCAGPRRSTRSCSPWSAAPTARCRCATSWRCWRPRTRCRPTARRGRPARRRATWSSAASCCRRREPGPLPTGRGRRWPVRAVVQTSAGPASRSTARWSARSRTGCWYSSA